MSQDQIVTQQNKLNVYRRLWIYQAERFPLLKHGVLIIAFALSAVCVSALLRGQTEFPSFYSFLTAFAVLLGLFLQLRIADEFKDAEIDAKTRPERAVPRGLISLKELAVLGLFTAAIQVTITVLYAPSLLIILTIIWVYMALMSAEFFVPEWLKAHPFIYMFSHMLIMPLIDLFATACDWLLQTGTAPGGLIWFLAVSLFNGIILELGRKTWAPEAERSGVESYSSAWGIPTALFVWAIAVLCAFGCAMAVALKINFLMPTLIILGVFSLVMAFLALSFFKKPTLKGQKNLENISGLWVFAVYFILGLIPMGVHAWL